MFAQNCYCRKVVLPSFVMVIIILFNFVNTTIISNELFDGSDSRPNIVLFLTDDQDVTLQGLFPMSRTQNIIALNGATFLNAFTSSPICCPSRSSILSGRYAHNHATINNSHSGGCYGDFWREKIEPKAIPVELQKNGYETFFAGKYLNTYSSEKVPPGWSQFYGLHGNSRYYDYNLTENGEVVSYTNEYLTDVLKEKAFEFLKNRGTKENPFFAMISTPAPHAPYTPAPRHNETFSGLKALRTPNFNKVSKVLEKHWLVQVGNEMDSKLVDKIDLYFRKRWQSLLAVDEMVSEVVDYLEKSGDLENTYIIYTSDNGYHVGQFAQPIDKRQPYETDIRVPLLVRGPTILKKSVCKLPVALIDLFPTILEWAKIPIPDYVDGIPFGSEINFQKLTFKINKNYHRQILIEYWGEGNDETFNSECPGHKSDHLAQCDKDMDCHCQDSWNNTYSCIRHFASKTDKIYCEFRDEENFVEAYDLQLDPHQMTNLGYKMLPSERAMYSLALHNLTKCIGESCRKTNF